jgi:hypothetical protein
MFCNAHSRRLPFWLFDTLSIRMRQVSQEGFWSEYTYKDVRTCLSSDGVEVEKSAASLLVRSMLLMCKERRLKVDSARQYLAKPFFLNGSYFLSRYTDHASTFLCEIPMQIWRWLNRNMLAGSERGRRSDRLTGEVLPGEG